MRGRVAVLVFAVVLAVLAGMVHPLLAAGPLMVLGLPAGLMLAATCRYGDSYDVSHRYPPGAYLGSVGPHE